MVSGQLNIVRTDVMGGSQSVAIKMLTGMYIIYVNMHTTFFTKLDIHVYVLENSHIYMFLNVYISLLSVIEVSRTWKNMYM